ncbi:N-acetylneuraminate synthase family protein [Thiohalobacter sp. IOR34]|uniref:N-acetylneuraminate synthase family protein n=1 Tax=Thiohalobacter sp. IOR34 TaxID=3057176 RepID=UPI0025B1B15E|nr:N-acetylneuraminate synthase family protein [Thiohalobacter sp. IOR34]WJW76700.1 N-acetylneuraminate synthase family protein [Thiohalobacter sp. IOR34]
MDIELSKEFEIAGRRVGINEPCYIIAEAGVAHFGNYDKALRLVDLAIESEADSVKFQVFDIDAMIADSASDWKERLASRCLPYSDFERLKKYCDDQGITFLATAHDEPSLDFLSDLDVPAYKIGSGELRNWPYLKKTAGYGKPVIFSTGMYTSNEVQMALDVMTQTGNKDISVLHCVTSYPTPPNDINLRVMDLYRERFGGIIGFSDHTEGFHIPLAAVARGAKVIEKHISLDFNVPNAQDWKVSCGPHDLARFIRELRDIEVALGHASKHPSEMEKENMGWARKSLVARRALKAGERLSEDMLTSKRPGNGISPDQIDKVLGKVTNRDLPVDSVIQWEDLV